MDEDELRVLGEPHDAPDDVWQGALSEAMSRPVDESLADFLTWDDNPGLDDGLDTGWDDPSYGHESWEDGTPALTDPGTDLTHGGLDDGDWSEDHGHTPLDDTGDDPFGHDDGLGHDGTLDHDSALGHDGTLDHDGGVGDTMGHDDPNSWFDAEGGFDGS